MVMSKILFQEKQTFGSLSLYLSMGVIYIASILLFSVGIYKQIFMGEPWGDKPVSDTGLVIAAILVLLILVVSAILLFGSVLSTTVYSDRLEITFWPYFKKPVVFNKDSIASFEIRQYKPLKEYGGWGVRYGTKGSGKAYNVRGNKGLQILTKDNKRLLLGTQRSDALLHSMKKMMGDK